MDALVDIFNWITFKSTDFNPPAYVLTAALAFGILLYFSKPTHRISKLLGSLIHEAGHATVALFLGLKVSKIKLDAIGNGVTEFYSYSGLRNFPVALAGYIAPPSLALLLTYNITNNTLNMAIAILGFLLIMLTIFVRSWVALLVNLGFALLVYLTFTSAPIVAAIIIFIFSGVMLASGVMGVISAYKVRKEQGRNAGTDPQILSRMTLIIPAILWEAAFLVYAIGSAVLVLLILWAPDIIL